MAQEKEVQLVLARFSQSKLSKEDRMSGISKKGQAVYHFQDENGNPVPGTLSRHIRVVNGRAFGRARNYYDQGDEEGALTKQSKALGVLMEVAHKQEDAEIELTCVLESQKILKKDIEKYKETRNDQLDQLNAEVMAGLINDNDEGFMGVQLLELKIKQLEDIANGVVANEVNKAMEKFRKTSEVLRKTNENFKKVQKEFPLEEEYDYPM